MYYIYEIKNIINNKRYIGRTKYPEKRKERHFRELKANKHHSIYLQRAFNKYGEENFVFNILQEVENEEEAIKLEQEYLNTPNDCHYNVSKLASGGDLISYHPNKEEIKKKISEASKMMHTRMTEEQKLLFRLKHSGENNGMFGRKHSEETKKKMSVNKKVKRGKDHHQYGKTLSSETKKKISEPKKGNIPWNKGLKGVQKWTEEQRRKRKENGLPKLRKKIYCEGKIFDSITEACEYYGITAGAMTHRLKSNKEKWKEFYYLS